MSQPVAIVTGGASGIGLAVTRHLLSKGFRVAIADLNVSEGTRLASELGDSCTFIQTDISSFEQQRNLFSKAFAWGGNRLDFAALNAGIDDRQSLYEINEPLDDNGLPKPLNLKTLDVDLNAVFQGVWLFKYYARKNKTPGGKLVITSSAAGIYPMPTNPQYSAAKHAIVGLVRSASIVFAKENITINCICPAFVVTNLCPPAVLDKFPKEHITPMSTVLKAFDAFLAEENITGQAVELSLGDLYFRKQPEFANESQKWLNGESNDFWEEAYKASLPQAKI